VRRREFLSAAAGISLAMPLDAAVPKGSIIELRRYQLRNNNDQMMQRTSEFIEKFALPAAQRAGIGPNGVFTTLIGPQMPAVWLLYSYPSLAAMEAAQAKTSEDKEFQQALEAYYAKPGIAYERVEATLFRAIDGMPKVEPPPIEKDKPARIFELRVYESNYPSTLRRKVKMFEDGELAIFRRVGMWPVFFGAALAGSNIPNLTYMLGYDSLAHREQVWRAFSQDAEWKKLRVQPGLSDAEIVSNISGTMLRPMPFSQIR